MPRPAEPQPMVSGIVEGNESVSAFYSSLDYSLEKRVSMGKRISENIPAA
jgi:hypothetical protein